MTISLKVTAPTSATTIPAVLTGEAEAEAASATQVVPVQAVERQELSVQLGGQSVDLAIYAKTTGLYVDMDLNGAVHVRGVRALNSVPFNDLGFSGALYFADTRGGDEPAWKGLGSRFELRWDKP